MTKYKRLSLEEREQIHAFVNQGKTNREISLHLNRSHRAISKELKRCGTKFEYPPSKSHKNPRGKDFLRGRDQIADSKPGVLQEVLKKLALKHFPEQISVSMKNECPDTIQKDGYRMNPFINTFIHFL